MKLAVTVLGSSDAFCSGGHPHAAYLFETGVSTLLVDCGPTLLLSMKQRGIDTACLDAVVISHFHGDHFGGLPFLLLEYMWERPRDRPLVVAGPSGIEERLWTLFRALYRDVVPEQLPFALEFRELQPEREAEVAGVTILPIRVPHQLEDVALALRFEVAGKRVLYSGDTPWVERFVELADGADLFLCECTAYESSMGRHIDWQTLSALLPYLKCRRLVLVHLGREMRERCGTLGVECATEGMKIVLGGTAKGLSPPAAGAIPQWGSDVVPEHPPSASGFSLSGHGRGAGAAGVPPTASRARSHAPRSPRGRRPR